MAIDRKRRAAWWAAAVYHASSPAATGPSYDADAAAYIASANALFPEEVYTLVEGLKADGDWNSLVSIKIPVGVPTLTDSLVDMRTPSLLGTAVNTPGHGATTGWTIVPASAQYINSKFNPNTHASLNSVHLGAKVMTYGGSGTSRYIAGANATTGVQLFANASGTVFGNVNDTTGLNTGDALTPGLFVLTRTGATARAIYEDGVSIGSDAQASSAIPNIEVYVGCRNNSGSPQLYYDGRITAFFAGLGLSAAAAARVRSRIQTYLTACGEA